MLQMAGEEMPPIGAIDGLVVVSAVVGYIKLRSGTIRIIVKNKDSI
jgi:hypothetical protein